MRRDLIDTELDATWNMTVMVLIHRCRVAYREGPGRPTGEGGDTVGVQFVKHEMFGTAVP